MRILLLGGTGAMGKHLVEILSADAKNYIAVTSRSVKQSNGNVNYLKGDAHDLSFLNHVLKEPWDVIVDFMIYNTLAFKERLNTLLGATRQYVFISSARVYSSSELPIKETHPRLLDATLDNEYLATDEYALTKARQENLLRESECENWTIIRPYITFSESRLQLGVLEKEDWLYRALHGRPIVFAKEMMDKMTTLTYGLDVAKGICAVIGSGSALSEAFHITNAKSLCWSDVLNIYLDVLEEHLGYRPKVLLQSIEECYQWHPAKYQIKYDRLFARQFDNEKINSFINTEDFTDVANGLRHCLKEFLQKPNFKNINWRAEAIKDYSCGTHTRLNEIPTFKQKIRYLVSRYLSV